jgi:hypothetical protein
VKTKGFRLKPSYLQSVVIDMSQVALTELPAPAGERRPLPEIIWTRMTSACEWLFGAAALIACLAFLAAIPVVQFISLGYLLEAGGSVARSGRFRDGFIAVRQAARLGSIVLGTWLMLLPLRLMASVARSADLIDPDGPVAGKWRLWLTGVTVLMALHITAACSRGGKLRYFLWPFQNPFWLVRRLRQGGYYAAARDAVWDFVVALRLPYYFWLGVRGFAGTMAWLVGPITLLALGRQVPLLGFAGGAALGIVVLYLPFLQIRFAAGNRWRGLFEVGAIREGYCRCPWEYAVGAVVTLAFAVPLYLLKIEMIPREAAWLPGILFIAFMFPARLLTGWAYAGSQRRRTRRHWFFRWTGRLTIMAAAAAYVVIVFFSQYAAWQGIWSLYEQHAFLLPVPFTGM